MIGRWRRRVRFLGDAFLEVLHAEVDALLVELQTTGKGWLKAFLLGTLAATFCFWTVGVFTAFLIALLSSWVGVWQAAGIVSLAWGGASGLFAFLAWRTFRKERGPVVVVRGHLADHLAWWQNNLDGERPTLEPNQEGQEEDPWEEEDGWEDPKGTGGERP